MFYLMESDVSNIMPRAVSSFIAPGLERSQDNMHGLTFIKGQLLYQNYSNIMSNMATEHKMLKGAAGLYEGIIHFLFKF